MSLYRNLFLGLLLIMPYCGIGQVNLNLNILPADNDPQLYEESSVGGYESEAQAFFDSTELEGVTLLAYEKDATNTLVEGLKNGGYWDSIIAIYPFVGNELGPYKWNLADLRDQDTAYRISMTGGSYMRANNGLLGEQTTFNTHIKPSTIFNPNNITAFVYSGYDETAGSDYEFGVTDAAGRDYILDLETGAGGVRAAAHQTGVGQIWTKNYADRTAGLWIFQRTSDVATGLQVWDDTISLGTKAHYGEALANKDIYLLGKNNNGSLNSFGRVNLKFTMFINGLTDDGIDSVANMINAFQISLHREVGRDNDHIILTDNGNFLPKTETNTHLDTYKNFDIGGIIHFSMLTWDYLPTSRILPPHRFNASDVNVQAWVDSAVSVGIDYLVFTVMDQSGFALWNNTVEYPDYIINMGPRYKKYDVSISNGDTSIISNLWSACETAGIEIIPYFGPTSNGNMLTRYNQVYWNNLDIDTDSTTLVYWSNWYAGVIQDFLGKYESNYVWMDVGDKTEIYMDTIFNAINSIDSTIQIIGNTIGDTGFAMFPYDIGSNEEVYSGADEKGWAAILDSTRSNGGTSYHVPQELVTNIFNGSSPWYWASDQVLESQAEVQAMKDTADVYNANFLLNLAPDTMGIIPTEQWAIFRQLE